MTVTSDIVCTHQQIYVPKAIGQVFIPHFSEHHLQKKPIPHNIQYASPPEDAVGIDESSYCCMSYSNTDLIVFISPQGAAQLLTGGGHCLASFEEKQLCCTKSYQNKSRETCSSSPPFCILQKAQLGCALERGAKHPNQQGLGGGWGVQAQAQADVAMPL